MEKRHKDILRGRVVELRRTLVGTADGSRRGDLDRALERLGIATDSGIMPFDTLPNPTPAERHARQVAEAELAAADPKERPAVRAAFVERAAYGWVNRLLALRVLEARGLIDETLRGNAAYDGLSEALYVLRQSDPARASGPDGGWWAVIEDACSTQAAALPGLFALDAPRIAGSSSALHDPAIALRPGALALVRCVEMLGAPPASTPKGQEDVALAEMDAAFADPDAIGWAYQFYQDEAKAQVYARLKAGKKVTTRDDIAAATQLFTEPYMVQWLLQNSLGRSYHEAYPQSTLPTTWAYYMRPERLDVPAFSTLESLTLLDPCVGSGHFVREAFDMFVAMYREQQPDLSATEIADRILEHHLHGIDIDPRAAQLAAFTLYARAWELVRDERRAQRRPGSGSYTPKAMNLAASPERIGPGALVRHLQRHPDDCLLEPLLKGVFDALERADLLGSLLRPRKHLQAAIAELRKPHNLRLGTREEREFQATIETVARTDPTHLEEMMLDRVAASFAAEARDSGDVAAALFGRAAERGVRLLQILDRQYAIVTTNPPYMGSANMDALLRSYVEHHYTPGKRDLYAAFIMRCLELTVSGGRVAMVTQQSWMFLGSFADLRALPEEELAKAIESGAFTGLLRETSLETLAHLGPNAFEEIGGEVVQSAMFVTNWRSPTPHHRLTALRLVGLRSASDKAIALRRVALGTPIGGRGASGSTYSFDQQMALFIPKAPIVYSLPHGLLLALQGNKRAGRFLSSVNGSRTGDNSRFIRLYWEVPYLTKRPRWLPYAKGGGPARWLGNDEFVIDWSAGAVGHYRSSKIGRCTEEQYWKRVGLSFNKISRGNLTVRFVASGISDYGGPTLTAKTAAALLALMSILNTQLSSYIVFLLSPSYNTEIGDVLSIPLGDVEYRFDELSLIAETSICIKRQLLARDPTSREYEPNHSSERDDLEDEHARIGVWLSLLQGLAEKTFLESLNIEWSDLAQTDIGIPLSFYPLVPGHQGMPTKPYPGQQDLERIEELAALHVASSPFVPQQQVPNIKHRLRIAYQEGQPREHGIENDADDNNDDLTTLDSRLPVPTTTFLEDLSQSLHIHPISIYSLLQEIRSEGARCKPEDQRLLEDRLSVIVMRLLGHCWPKQLEACEPVPNWADDDGIIPLMPGSGEVLLADRVRERLRADDGELGVQQVEALLAELTGQNLETWLRRAFFPRHVRQFKYRPFAWHLASVPMAGTEGGRGKGRGSSRQMPAFECLVYYHACSQGLLARLRTQYVEPLLRAERGRVDASRQAGDETTAAQATARVQEMEAFMERLRGVEERGFDTPDLQKILPNEPLDRWSGDGILAPASRDALLAQERSWTVDINDGVRVNIAPLQLAGVLASDVLKDADAKKALADRVRWRADERRWVREGILPRCGWMAEDIPASPRWAERAPEREAEQHKLERKRAEVMGRLVQGDGGSK